MPVVSLTLEETTRSIVTNSYFKIIEDIINTIKIPDGVLVVLHNGMEVNVTDNKTNAVSQSNVNLPSTVSARRVQATIIEDYNEDELTTTGVNQQIAYPIFQDPDIDVSVYPIYVKSDVTIQFTYTSPSKSEATRIRDDIRLRLSQTRNIGIHEIEYDIIIPQIVEDFIEDVYTLKNRLNPMSLEEYFRDNSTKRVYVITDMVNQSNAKLAIKEKQIRIIGMFDFSGNPEKLDIDNENNNYKVTFNYKVSMDVPRAMAMRYPVMICNRLLPSKYISFISENKINSKEEFKKDLNYIGGMGALSHFESHRQLENRVDIKLPVNVPDFDDFNLRQGHKGYGITMSFLLQVNETDKKSLFNLRDIEPYQIPDVLLNYIKTTERNFITKPYMSWIYLGIHQGSKHYDNSILEVDENLNVKSTSVLSLYKPVRVTISISIDYSSIDSNAILRLLDNPEVLYIFLAEYIRTVNNFKTEGNGLDFNDNNFMREIILLIRRFIDREQLDIAKKILEIIGTDKYYSYKLARVLFSGLPETYNMIVNNNLLPKDESDYLTVLLDNGGRARQVNIPIREDNSASRADIEITRMKSVMGNYVIAKRLNE